MSKLEIPPAKPCFPAKDINQLKVNVEDICVRARRKVLAIKYIFFTQIIMLVSQKPMTDLFSENLHNGAVLQRAEVI